MYVGRIGSLVDEIIRASRTGERKDLPPHRHPGVAAMQVRQRDAAVDLRCAALLRRIMAQPAWIATRCVQFVACGVDRRACPVALGTARAGSMLLGRTLLLNLRLDEGSLAISQAGQESEPELPGSPVPDAFMPGLYHRNVANDAGDLELLYGGGRKEALQKIAEPFRLIVIDTAAASQRPAALAPFCAGSILVVAAGHGTLDEVTHAAKQINAAGGNILGTVLTHAPGDLPRWIKAR